MRDAAHTATLTHAAVRDLVDIAQAIAAVANRATASTRTISYTVVWGQERPEIEKQTAVIGGVLESLSRLHREWERVSQSIENLKEEWHEELDALDPSFNTEEK